MIDTQHVQWAIGNLRYQYALVSIEGDKRKCAIRYSFFLSESGCQTIQNPENGYIIRQTGGASIYLYCLPTYQLAGAQMSYCDGLNWDRALGSCRQTNIGPQTSCDFEVDDLCGWSADPTHSFEWKRQNGGDNPKKAVRTGPSHDHTTMKALSGHYVVAQSADQILDTAARLISPIYPQEKSVDACFRFYYHMYGLLVGRLRVYMKPVSVAMDVAISEPKYRLFERSGTDLNLWREVMFDLEPVNERFQLVIEATAGYTDLADIAIDDVALLRDTDCSMDSSFTTLTPTDETGAAFNIQTCVDRCGEERLAANSSSEIIKTGPGRGGLYLHCDCYVGCEDADTCCPDYRSVCAFCKFSCEFGDTFPIEFNRTHFFVFFLFY